MSRDVVEIAVLVGAVEIDRRREPPALQRERGNGGLECAGGAERVAVVALGAAHLKLGCVVAAYLLQREGLGRIVERRRAAVRVDVGNVGRRDVAVCECTTYRASCLRAV